MVKIEYVNSVYVSINCEQSILYEISDFFTFFVPNYKHHPKFKARIWDGKIRMLNIRTRMIYSGLIKYIEQFCNDRDYKFSYEFDNSSKEFSVHEAKEFIKTLNIPDKFEDREYQNEALAYCVRNSRCLFVSPTASGKSKMIYHLIRYYKVPTLIIVPRVALIQQMLSDFSTYGMDISSIHAISSNVEKYTNSEIVITTWQSIYKMPEDWFSRFRLGIGDEAHNFKATSLISIMTKLKNCPYRFGFTGSLDGDKVNKITLEGLFGPYKKIVTTNELIESGHIADLKLKIIVLQYSDDIKKQLKKSEYSKERDWIVSNESRNKFIKNLTLSLKGNTLVLYRLVEKHGIPLYEMIKKETNDQNVYLIHGKTDVDSREHIRKIVNEDKNAIIVASIGTFSEGINIPNINNIVFASPTKSRINVMQMIGRGLRKTPTKSFVTIFDIADNLSWKSWINYTYKHLYERIKYYNEEKFQYKLYKVNLL